MSIRLDMFFLGYQRSFGNVNRTLRADLDAVPAMGATLLPDSVRREPPLILHCFQTFDCEVLADLAALVAHGAKVAVDFVPYEILAFMDRAYTFNMTVEFLLMIFEKCRKNICVVLAFLAHAAVFDVHGDPLKLGSVLRSAFTRLNQFKNLDGIVDAELAGMTLGTHAVLRIVVIKFLELVLRGRHRTLIFLL
jgi:hypothetical protein